MALASVYPKTGEAHPNYRHRQVWRAGLEVAMKIKGSQDKRRVEWGKHEHPYTAISPASQVHANHNEAQNAAMRRRCSAYRQRQHHYAKKKPGFRITEGIRGPPINTQVGQAPLEFAKGSHTSYGSRLDFSTSVYRRTAL